MNPSDYLGGVYEETGLFTGVSALWSPYMRVRELHADSDACFVYWHAFGDAIGLDRLREAYGDYWPRRPTPGEQVFAFSDPETGGEIGWASLRRDPVDNFARLALGVWPRFQGKGWAHKIREWTFQAALDRWNVDGCTLEVLWTNDDHLRRQLERALLGAPWQVGGHMDCPLGKYTVFYRMRGA